MYRENLVDRQQFDAQVVDLFIWDAKKTSNSGVHARNSACFNVSDRKLVHLDSTHRTAVGMQPAARHVIAEPRARRESNRAFVEYGRPHVDVLTGKLNAGTHTTSTPIRLPMRSRSQGSIRDRKMLVHAMYPVI
jgi:hypothetical protein